MVAAVDSHRFDVVRCIRHLRSVGISQDVAEVQAQELEHLLEVAVNTSKEEFAYKDLATKQDVQQLALETKHEIKQLELAIKQLESSTKRDITELELRTDAKMKDVEIRLIKWLVGSGISTIVVMCGAMFTMFKLMLHTG